MDLNGPPDGDIADFVEEQEDVEAPGAFVHNAQEEDVDGLVEEAEDADITQEEEDVGHAPGMD
jgi:hypothetical protein